MDQPDLLGICLTAIAAVFILLTILAGAMYLITLIFPQAKHKVEAATVAAISSAMQAVLPGSKVTRIEEI